MRPLRFVPPLFAPLQSKLGKILDRANRYGVPQLMGVTLGLLSWFQAGSFLFYADRFYTSGTWTTVLAIAHPYVWGGLFVVAGGAVLLGALLDRDFTQGASLVLCSVWVIVGLLIVHPVMGGTGLPDRIGQYMGNAVFCMINQLLWRLRAAERGTR